MFLRFLVALLVFPITLAQGSPHNNLPLHGAESRLGSAAQARTQTQALVP